MKKKYYYPGHALNRYHNDPIYKLKHNLGSKVRRATKSKYWKKDGATKDILGVESYEHWRNHLESLFYGNMSWDNIDEWEIDHKVELNTASDEESVYKLFHYTNLQPLFRVDNVKKYNKVNSLKNTLTPEQLKDRAKQLHIIWKQKQKENKDGVVP